MIGCTEVVSVSVLYSRCYVLALSLCLMTQLPCVQWTFSLFLLCIYSVGILLYLYALPIAQFPFLTFKPLSKCNLSSKLRS